MLALAQGRAEHPGKEREREHGCPAMAEVVSDFYGELNDVLSKVNTWALGREKELLSLQAEHTSFLDTHNGRDRREGGPARRPPEGCLPCDASATTGCPCVGRSCSQRCAPCLEPFWTCWSASRYDDGAQAAGARGQGQGRKVDARSVSVLPGGNFLGLIHPGLHLRPAVCARAREICPNTCRFFRRR